jgi:hypothetical protein
MSREIDQERIQGRAEHSIRPARIEYRDREHSYQLNEEDMAALRTIGSFRVVNANDVPRSTVKRLVQQGLVEQKSAYARRGGERLDVAVLTKKGRNILASQRSMDDLQRFHVGLVKPNELAHDAAIYPAYKREAEAIEKTGGRVTRAVLDFELKAHINREMNRPEGPSPEDRRAQLSRDLDLPVIDDHLALPDVRIEYVDADGNEQHRDVEIVTEHYRGQRMAGKVSSGFKLVQAADVTRRAPVRDDHHLEFFS